MTILHTRIDNEAEKYLIENSFFDNSEIMDVFNSANYFPEPYMQISKLQATALQFFIRMTNAKNILEVGTFVGFSAFAMASIMDESSKLVSLEINEDFHDRAKYNQFLHIENFNKKKKSFVKGIRNINFIHADAKEYLKKISHEEAQKIDLFFLDGDKENYPFYLDWCREKLKKDAYLLIDNALFKGGVISGNGKYEEKIRELTLSLKKSSDFEYFFLPVGDCMIVAKKKE